MKPLQQQAPPVTHMCDLVFGSNDSILREFTELHVMIFREGESEETEETSAKFFLPDTSRWMQTEQVFSYFLSKTPSELHSADRGVPQEAEVSTNFPS